MSHPVESSPLAVFAEQRCWLICNAQKSPCDRHGRPLAGWQHKGATLADALKFVDGRTVAGVGLNLNRCAAVAIDFDAVLLDGQAHPAAARVLRDAPTFAERSWSGRGLHVFYTTLGQHAPISRTWKLAERPASGKWPQVSIFHRAPRFIITTGDGWGEPLRVGVVDAALLDEWAALFEALEPALSAPASTNAGGGPAQPPAQPAASRGMSRRQAEGLSAFVAAQPEGRRNASLYWAAHRAREGGATLAEALALLLPAARQCGLGETEATRTIQSAFAPHWAAMAARQPQPAMSAKPTARAARWRAIAEALTGGSHAGRS